MKSSPSLPESLSPRIPLSFGPSAITVNLSARQFRREFPGNIPALDKLLAKRFNFLAVRAAVTNHGRPGSGASRSAGTVPFPNSKVPFASEFQDRKESRVRS